MTRITVDVNDAWLGATNADFRGEPDRPQFGELVPRDQVLKVLIS